MQVMKQSKKHDCFWRRNLDNLSLFSCVFIIISTKSFVSIKKTFRVFISCMIYIKSDKIIREQFKKNVTVNPKNW